MLRGPGRLRNGGRLGLAVASRRRHGRHPADQERGAEAADGPLADEHNALLPPDAFRLPVGRPVTRTVYRDAAHPSRLVLPFTAGPATA